MRTYNIANTWTELPGLPPTTNENTGNIVITMSTEDAVDPHNAIGLLIDSMIDAADKIHSEAHPDEVKFHDFPLRETLDRILTIRGR